jgi:glycosyltransferase involved in cell wall biosynthesis
MRAEGVQHVHAHFASHPAAVAYVIGRLTGIPYSFTAHGSDLHRDRHMLKEKVLASEFVASISEYNKRIIVSECGEEAKSRVAVVHCGVDTSVFSPTERVAAVGEPFSILCIGTLHEVKGQTYLVEACRILREKGIDLKCHFVGDGPDQAALEKQVAVAGLRDHVVFHGRRSRDEVAALLAQADVVATPSVPTSDGRREGIPVVLMEAMGSGVPVVASDLSGIPELVRDGKSGLLFPPGDAEQLAAALARLNADPALRARLAAEGRRTVVEEFDQQRTAKTLIGLFRGDILP